MLILLLQASGLLAVTFLVFSYVGWWLGTKRAKPSVRRDVPPALTLSEEPSADSQDEIQPFMNGDHAPTDVQDTVTESEPENEPEVTPEPEPEPEPESEVTTEAEPEPDVDPESDAQAEPVSEVSSQPQEVVVPQAVEALPPVQVTLPIAPPRPLPGAGQTVTGRLHIDPTPRGLQRQSESVAQAIAHSEPTEMSQDNEPQQETSESPVTADNEPVRLTAPEGKPDDLKRISGITAANEKELNALGIFHHWQIAQCTPEQLDWLCRHMRFPMRAVRENWVGQAAKLVGNREENPAETHESLNLSQ